MTKNLFRLIAVLVAFVLLAAACGSNTDTDGAVDSSSTAEADNSTDSVDSLDIAFVMLGVQDEPWYSTMVDSLGRAQDASPHGLAVGFEAFENVAYSDGERIARDLASSGDFQIIIMHSIYSDAVDAVKGDFPEVLFAFSGSGNDATATGDNAYWIDAFTHEPAYLAGIVAGMMTETNVIGGVAAFPFPNVNSPLNAYIAGAQSVNPDVTAEVTYIESWFDPAKASESAVAQIAAGADMIYAERFGPFEAAQAADNVFAFGHFADQAAIAPEVVLASPEARWDPALASLIDTWYDHATNGTAYDGPSERIMFLMKDGGSEISALSEKVPEDVVAAVAEARDQIMSGDLIVEFNDAPVE